MSEIAEEVSEKEAEFIEREGECIRHKRRRRGKKRKFRKEVDRELDAEGFKMPLTRNSNRSPENKSSRKRPKTVLIRPVDVPKAPENSTQFIIDDHDECMLYINFETPDPCGKPLSQSKAEDYAEDAAFQDIDYQYESMQDLDNSAYYLQDFEDSYSNVRCEELQRLSRSDLVTAIENLEQQMVELEDQLCKKDPSSALEQLQRQLLDLQEENSALRETKTHLVELLGGADNVLNETINSSEYAEDGECIHHVNSYESDSSHDSSLESHDESDDSFGESNLAEENFLPSSNSQLRISFENLHNSDGSDVSCDEKNDHLQNGNSDVMSCSPNISQHSNDASRSPTHSLILQGSTGNSQDVISYSQNSNDFSGHLSANEAHELPRTSPEYLHSDVRQLDTEIENSQNSTSELLQDNTDYSDVTKRLENSCHVTGDSQDVEADCSVVNEQLRNAADHFGDTSEHSLNALNMSEHSQSELSPSVSSNVVYDAD